MEDAKQGLGFVDVCRHAYDAILMNPPFGEASKPAKSYLDHAYPRTRNDLYAAFVECETERLIPGGLLGAITSRTGFFLSSFQKWREEILLAKVRPTVFADLGFGVLDNAKVETAAYCLEAAQVPRESIFFRLLELGNHADSLSEAITSQYKGDSPSLMYPVTADSFRQMPVDSPVRLLG